jgi:hypothetical protein
MKANTNTANSTFSNDEFGEIMQEKSNTCCFDCGKSPASWASVNNAVYLCMNCAGNHRGYGVNISYIRSITIDTWNETQLAFMKNGGNKKLEELMGLFEVPRSTPSQVLFASKLLEYYRNQLKSDVNKGKQLIPPRMEDALQPMDSLNIKNEYHSNPNPSSNIYSVSSNTGNDFEQKTNQGGGGFMSSFSSFYGKAVEKGKNVANNVKDKVVELDLKTKITNTGAKAVEKMKETGSIVKDKAIYGAEVLKDASGKALVQGIVYGVITIL